MRNWYHFANNELAMARDIAVWLRQAAQGNFDLATANDDITNRQGRLDDPDALSTAIESASATVSQEQGGILFPFQQQLVQYLYERIQGGVSSSNESQIDMNIIPQEEQNLQQEQLN